MKIPIILLMVPLALCAPAPQLLSSIFNGLTDGLGKVTGGLVQVTDGVFAIVNGVLAPLLKPPAPLIANHYIVKLKDNSPLATLQKVLSLLTTGNATNVYNSDLFKGFSVYLDANSLAFLQKLNVVDFIEQDSVVKSDKYVTQAGATWGIARISHKDKGQTTYVYDDSGGAGTCAYVIDSGIYTAHSDFGGRATWLANFVDKNNTDGAGHGTHIAGTIGGNTYGVAKKTKLYAVKVLDATGTGSVSGIIAGINFVANDIKTRACPNGTVTNMSLGAGLSESLNSAAKSLVNAGVFVAVSAGNDNKNASNQSPAAEPSVCTVGATTSTDDVWTQSNWGVSVDIFAPGSYITSAGIAGPNSYYIMSGTSMATPHIAGLGAYLLTFRGKRTPAALCTYMKTLAQPNKITALSANTANLLAFNGNPAG